MKLPAAIDQQAGDDHRLAAPAVGSQAEGNLQESLRQTVGAQRQADQHDVVAARQASGQHGEYRQHQEQAEHAQAEDGGQHAAGAPFGGGHGIDYGREHAGQYLGWRGRVYYQVAIKPPATMDFIKIRGARTHNLKNINARSAAQPADRDHRPVRFRQEFAGLRHALRRGPAPLRRVALGLRAPVPAVDGKARCRPDRGPVAGHFHRAEGHQPQPALHRRHGHRDPRLPAPALRPRRHAALPGARPAARSARACRRWSITCWPCPRTPS